MSLQAIHDKIEEIPEQFRELYTEKNGKFELTGISGVKTTADVTRVQTALNSERELRQAAENKLKVWDGLDHEEIMSKIDRVEELQSIVDSRGGLDDAKIDEIANKRVEGIMNSRINPLERQIQSLTRERDDFKGQVEGFQHKDRTRSIRDDVRSVLVSEKVVPEAHDDILMIAERMFERTEDGQSITKEGNGVTPGLSPKDWLNEMKPVRSFWWPASKGAGANGNTGAGGDGFDSNPWTRENWNITKQGEVLNGEDGAALAERMAKAAGSDVNAIRPPAAK